MMRPGVPTPLPTCTPAFAQSAQDVLFQIRPFLKWAGNKYRLASQIYEILQPYFCDNTLWVEPFAGSGAVFLNLPVQQAVLGDTNPDLITLYQMLQYHGTDFIEACRPFFTPVYNTAVQYQSLRAQFNRTDDPYLKSILFLYLNRHGYNGLCRYNAKRQFNVPFGRYPKPYFPEAELHAFLHQAHQARFVCQDFKTLLASLQPGSIVYCDPPYVPLSATASFTGYRAGGFGEADQIQLAHWAKKLASQDIPVLISNHDVSFTRALYRDAQITPLSVQRYISCKGSSRKKVPELLALFGPV